MVSPTFNVICVICEICGLNERKANLNDLRVPPANRLEALSGSREGQHSIRINSQWRICFEWREDGVYGVEIVDYH